MRLRGFASPAMGTVKVNSSEGLKMAQFWSSHPGLTERLIELWNGGASATQAAAALGNGLTRNACVAKIDRLRASGVELRRVQVYVKKPPAPRPPKPVAVKAAPAADPRLLEPLEMEGEPITAMNATRHHCRYGYGEPAEDGFRYCGRAVVPKSSFCENHGRLCHAPKHPATQEIEAA